MKGRRRRRAAAVPAQGLAGFSVLLGGVRTAAAATGDI